MRSLYVDIANYLIEINKLKYLIIPFCIIGAILFYTVGSVTEDYKQQIAYFKSIEFLNLNDEINDSVKIIFDDQGMINFELLKGQKLKIYVSCVERLMKPNEKIDDYSFLKEGDIIKKEKILTPYLFTEMSMYLDIYIRIKLKIQI